MNYLHSFKNFDPKTGASPELFFYQFNRVAERARALLKHRGVEEIENGLEQIDRILAASRLDSVNEWVRAGGQEVMVFENAVTYLTYHMINYDHSDPELSVDKSLWPEYFAVLALALVGHAKSIEKVRYPYFGFTEEHAENSNRDLIIGCLADSEEAINYADFLFEFEKSDGNIKEETAENTQGEAKLVLANKLFMDNARIKNEFVLFWQNSAFQSAADAACRFYEKLPDRDKRVLCPALMLKYATRTLETYLRRYEHGKKQIPEASVE